MMYRHQPFGATAVLLNTILTALATCTSFLTPGDLESLPWALSSHHGTAVLALLHGLDRRVATAKQEVGRAKHDKRERKKAEDQERQEEEKREKAAQREHEKLCKAAEVAKRKLEEAEAKHVKALAQALEREEKAY